MEDTLKNKAAMPTKNICLGILAHVDAGKTTLSECLLYETGAIRSMGRVDHKDTFLDTDAMEKERGITIFSKQAVVNWQGTKITLLDTPGHVDFSAEAERVLQVLDAAVLVISGSDGVQGHTETLWKLLRQHNVPVFLFINKMDLVGTDKAAVLADLKKRLSENCQDFSFLSEAHYFKNAISDEKTESSNVSGTKAGNNDAELIEFFENAAMSDEEALEEFLETERLSIETLGRLIRERHLFPCFFGSALKGEGVRELLEGITACTGTKKWPGQFGARVFKISRDEQGNRLTHMKITGGSLKVKSTLTNANTLGQNGQKVTGEEVWEEKADQIRMYSGSKFTLAEEAEAGCVCAVKGLSKTWPGQALGAEKGVQQPLLQPVLTYTVLPEEGCDIHLLLKNLRLLEEEDPQLHVVWQEKLKEIHLQLMGAVQLEVVKRMIWDRFHVEVEFGPGNILYRETIENTVEGVGHFEPLRHYAEAHLLLEPAERGSGLTFATACSEDVLDLNWQRLILTHLAEKEHVGVLTGAPITDMRITVLTGRAHTKHTEGGDFRQATYRALRQGLMQAKSILLEPWYSFRLEVPQEQLGRAMSDIQRMNGRFDAPEMDEDMAILTGSAPVSEMREYMTEVHAYTKGRGRFSCSLKGYEPCHNADEVIAAAGYDPESDVENTPDSVFCAHGAGFIVRWDQVKEHMHVESGWQPDEDEPEEELYAPQPERKPVPKDHSLYGSWKEDRELEEIFNRTFGSKGERVIPSYHRVSYGSRSGRSEASLAATAAYREAHARPAGVQKDYLLVDGYNIIFAWDELKELAKDNLDAARLKLMDMLCNYQGFTRCELICVFDAYKVKGGTGEVSMYHNIHVVYTKEAQTADAYIEKTSKELAQKHKVRVATSDALEQVIVMGHGAVRVSARELHEELGQIAAQMQEYYRDKEEKFVNRPFDANRE